MWYREIANKKERWERLAADDYTISSIATLRVAGAGMSRLYNHMTHGPFSIMTPYLASLSNAENKKRMIQFKARLRALGLGFADTDGAWEDTRDKKPETPSDAPKNYVKEKSVFIPNITRQQALQFGRDYDQDGIIVGDQGKYDIEPVMGTEWDPIHGDISDSHSPDLHIIRDKEQPEAYTSIRHKRFTFQPYAGAEDKLPAVKAAERSNYRLAMPDEAPTRFYYATVKPFSIAWPMHGITQKDMLLGVREGMENFRVCLPLVPDGQAVRTADKVESQEPLSPKMMSLYLRKVDEPEDRFHDVPFQEDPAYYTGRLHDAAQFTGRLHDAAQHLNDHPELRLNGVFSSVYVAPDGQVHILNPHKHDQTAANVLLQRNIPEGYRMTRQTMPKTKDIRPNAMMRYLGLMRAQFLKDGVGLSVEMSRPPTYEQVKTVVDYYNTTSKETFVAEIYWQGELISHITSPRDLRYFLTNFDANNPRHSGKPVTNMREFLASIDSARIVKT